MKTTRNIVIDVDVWLEIEKLVSKNREKYKSISNFIVEASKRRLEIEKKKL